MGQRSWSSVQNAVQIWGQGYREAPTAGDEVELSVNQGLHSVCVQCGNCKSVELPGTKGVWVWDDTGEKQGPCVLIRQFEALF